MSLLLLSTTIVICSNQRTLCVIYPPSLKEEIEFKMPKKSKGKPRGQGRLDQGSDDDTVFNDNVSVISNVSSGPSMKDEAGLNGADGGVDELSQEDRKSTRSELQSHHDLVCRLLLEKKKKIINPFTHSSRMPSSA